MKKTGLLLSLLLIFAISIVALTACFSFVTVTFGSNGGTAVEPQRIARGATATEPDAPTRDGFTFSRWVLSGESEAFDFSTPITGNTTLIAVWSIDYHRVTFDLGLNRGGDETFYYSYTAHGEFAVPPARNPGDIRAPVAVVLVIDRSGSMSYRCPVANVNRDLIDIAKESAAGVVNALSIWDYVGVVSFAGNARMDIGITSATQGSLVLDAIAEIEAGGGGAIYSEAIQTAGSMLQVFGYGRVVSRHIIFITNGEPHESFDEFASYIEFFYKEGITLSVVGTVDGWAGGARFRWMGRLAELGGGRAYFMHDIYPDLGHMEVSSLKDTAPRLRFLHWILADKNGTIIDADAPFLFEYTLVTAPIRLAAVWVQYHTVIFDLGFGGAPFYYKDVRMGEFAVPPICNPDDVDTLFDGSVAVVVAISRSSSMGEVVHGTGGRTRMEIAMDAVRGLRRTLSSRDYVGIVSFAATARIERMVSPVVQQVAWPGPLMTVGNSYISEGLSLAGRMLQIRLGGYRSEVRRHIMLFTDGKADQSSEYEPYIEHFYNNYGITLSVFGIESPDITEDAVRHMAELGGGRYYFGCVTLLSDFMREEIRILHQGARLRFLHWTLADKNGTIIDADAPFLFEYTLVTAPIRLAAVWRLLDCSEAGD